MGRELDELFSLFSGGGGGGGGNLAHTLLLSYHGMSLNSNPNQFEGYQ